MEDRYELTVIISNYHQERHLSETIESALAQQANFPYRIIITDDGSSQDHSREIIREYAGKHSDLEAVFGSENRGYLTNILRVTGKMKTKYFCLLDADDYWTDRDFLQRAYDFLETHDEYSIYESNVEAVPEGQESSGKGRHLFVSPKIKAGTYSKEIFLKSKPVPITQTTGMFLRNCIFADGIPEIMKNAVGTRAERSFEGDTGRFIMHLKHGLAYYDQRVVGIYRLTDNGIWNRLTRSKKQLIKARMQQDFYRYYGSDAAFFANRAYKAFQRFFLEKQKELAGLSGQDELIDEEERLMAEDVYQFCKEHKDEILKERDSAAGKAKQILRILRT